MRNTKIGEEERKALLSKPFDINDRVAMITPPGVRAIKQCEMYDKWQRFIPAEHITDIYKQPDEDIVNELKDDKQKKRLFWETKKHHRPRQRLLLWHQEREKPLPQR
jgi:hypothetical protein